MGKLQWWGGGGLFLPGVFYHFPLMWKRSSRCFTKGSD